MSIKYWQIGGSIRDEFLGLKSKDIDYAVEAPSYEAMKNDILARGGTIYLETQKFLTIRAKMPSIGDADFVLCRKDGEYHDGRSPESVDPGTIDDDLARRDFRMNAIARNMETGEIYDPFNGILDIRDEMIHCVGNAWDRFNEDRLRILRAIRFAVTKGFNLSWEINEFMYKEAIYENALQGVSKERVREELFKMFSHDTVKSLEMVSRYNAFFMKNIFNNPDMGIRLEPTLRKN